MPLPGEGLLIDEVPAHRLPVRDDVRIDGEYRDIIWMAALDPVGEGRT